MESGAGAVFGSRHCAPPTTPVCGHSTPPHPSTAGRGADLPPPSPATRSPACERLCTHECAGMQRHSPGGSQLATTEVAPRVNHTAGNCWLIMRLNATVSHPSTVSRNARSDQQAAECSCLGNRSHLPTVWGRESEGQESIRNLVRSACRSPSMLLTHAVNAHMSIIVVLVGSRLRGANGCSTQPSSTQLCSCSDLRSAGLRSAVRSPRPTAAADVDGQRICSHHSTTAAEQQCR